ncbi:VOC family protein [Oceanobacillus bengalensis]|uniref:VOC family protein n=1 Tax=Oceanobacillus bengalensis TaxID=1435466 RepID=A0A494YW65_9BACI|nr:VOC family protein [Oceanobacillus bengalensis]RKQ14391.1 VOC family protein [Oceanobacillus bengalensis]
MSSPIKNQINTIFVHVSDLEKSVKWYSQLLNQTIDLTTVSKPVHNLSITHYTGLTLDAGPIGYKKEIVPSKYPLFNFHTHDIEQSLAYVKKLGLQVESSIIQFDDFAYFNISDPDKNIIMICTG